MSVNGNGLTTGRRPFPADEVDCELCAAARYTHWYQVGEHGWVADCEVCQVPMAVWWHHGPDAPESAVEELLTMLSEAADHRFGAGHWTVDRTMRQVPGHFHAHARDRDWLTKRWTRPMSLYTGVGGLRRTR